MMQLDKIGILAGTDKSRLGHDYLRQYDRLFQPFVNQTITVLEIGIHNGASLVTWERYFPNAQIVGIDIEPATSRFARERVQVEIGSQVDAAFLATLGKKYAPSIMIDDGSHVDEHQIFSFEHLFPHLQPGGIYVVEDIQGFKQPTLAADHFLQLQRACLLRTPLPGIAAIEVIPGAVIIHKTGSDELDKNFSELEKLANASEQPEATLYLSRYMQQHGAPQEAVLRTIRKACEMAPNNPWAKFDLSKVLAMQGDLEQALAVVKQAIEIAPVPHQLYFEHQEMLERKLGKLA